MSINNPDSTGPAADGGSNSGLNKKFGSHFIVELVNCVPDRLRKVHDVELIMEQVVRK